MCEIERTLRRGTGTPHIKYDKGKFEGHKREIQEILAILNTPSSYLDEDPNVSELALHLLAPFGPDNCASIPESESGAIFATPSLILYSVLIASTSVYQNATFQPADV